MTSLYSEHFTRLWQNYEDARVAYELLKGQLGEAKAAMETAERKLIDAMLDAKVNHMEINGLQPHMATITDVTVTQKAHEEIEAWLERERGGADTFKRFILDGNLVKRFIREEIKDGAEPSSYPACLKVAVRTVLRVRGWDKESPDVNE